MFCTQARCFFLRTNYSAPLTLSLYLSSPNFTSNKYFVNCTPIVPTPNPVTPYPVFVNFIPSFDYIYLEMFGSFQGLPSTVVSKNGTFFPTVNNLHQPQYKENLFNTILQMSIGISTTNHFQLAKKSLF